jgi:hypothetical protein
LTTHVTRAQHSDNKNTARREHDALNRSRFNSHRSYSTRTGVLANTRAERRLAREKNDC